MRFRALAFLTALLCAAALAFAQAKPRARDLGVPFDGIPGPNNAITDVRGVEVGHTTLISGSGKLKVGEGPVRTGVTAVLPRGKDSLDPVFGAWFTLNGNGVGSGTTDGSAGATCAGTSTTRRSRASTRRSRQGRAKPGSPSSASPKVRLNSSA